MLDRDRVTGLPSYAQASSSKAKTTPQVLVIAAAMNTDTARLGLSEGSACLGPYGRTEIRREQEIK